MIQAKWNSLQWELTPDNAKLLKGAGITKTLKTQEQETKSGQNPVNTQGYEPQSLSLSYTAAINAGTQPRSELDKLKKLLGKTGALYINGQAFGPPCLMLDKITFTSDKINSNGIIMIAEITLNFSEDLETAQVAPAAIEKSYEESTQDPAPGIVPGLQDNTETSAYNIRPTEGQITAKLNE